MLKGVGGRKERGKKHERSAEQILCATGKKELRNRITCKKVTVPPPTSHHHIPRKMSCVADTVQYNNLYATWQRLSSAQDISAWD